MPAIGADDDVGTLGYRRVVLRSALDADDAPVLREYLLDGESFSDLRTGFGRGVYEQLVQNGPPRAVGNRRSRRTRRPRDRERTEIERVRVNRRTSRRREAIEQTPPRERSHTERVHHVRGHRI